MASKQSTWDKPGILAESTAVEETQPSPFQRTCLLAVCAPVVTEQAADRKCSKYTELSSIHEFQPVAVESHGSLSNTAASFLAELGCKITDHSGEPLEAQFLFQRVSVLVQHFNSILFRETFLDEDYTDTWPFQPAFVFLTYLLLTPGSLYRGYLKK